MTQATTLDPRLTPARRDLAAASLRGKVDAVQYVEGERFTVLTDVLDMRRRPRPDAPLDTQLLYGESLTVYDDDEGWGWAQADSDGYVGYVPMSALGRAPLHPTHRVTVNRTFIYPAADMKQPPFGVVPLGGCVRVEGTRGEFVKIGGHGFVFATHVAPLADVAHDFVAVAEQLVGAPYLWGGKSAQGIDCSGLVQLACTLTGRNMPRDTDMQERIGHALVCDDRLVNVEAIDGCRRGDLVFWKGHVGILGDASTLLHANAHHMLVVREPFDVARARILRNGLPITSIRRLT